MMIFFVQGFCGTLQFKVVILGMQVDDDVLYFGIENQPSAPFLPSIYPVSFLSIL